MDTIPLNPYVAGNPVGDSPAFVGRVDVLRDVQRVLRRPQDNALVLYGQRRIGKTSILQHLFTQLPNEGPYFPVYFDLQDKAAWTLCKVLQDLAQTIAYRLALPEPDLGDDPETAFRQTWIPAVLENLPEGSGLVLLFDEFDVLANPKEEQAATAFFPYLRDLMTQDPQRLQFVFVIGRNVADLTNIALSLFKGIGSKRISLLSREATISLVQLSESNGSLHWPDESIEQVWQLTHGHPFLTQQLCSHVWEASYDEEPDDVPVVTPTEVNAVIDNALEASRNTLEWLWNGLPPAERVVSSAFAEAGPGSISQDELERVLYESGVRVVIRDLQNAPQQLQDWDILEPVDDGYCFRVELLRRWITTYKPLKRVQEELDHIEPVAQSFYSAAQGFYQASRLDDAIDPLRQAISLNPNHLGANQLLAEILLSQDQLDEAQELLERLYEYQPSVAHHRLIQVLLSQSNKSKNDDEKLNLYERILEINSTQPEAQTGRQLIWRKRGDVAFQSNNLEDALYAYDIAGLTEKAREVEKEISRRYLEEQMQRLQELERTEDYQQALELAHDLSETYPETTEWASYLDRLEFGYTMHNWYQRALGALQSDDQETAQNLLVKVISQEPAYKEATRYLHLAVTGVDVADLQHQLESEKKARQEREQNRHRVAKTTRPHRQKVQLPENLSLLLQTTDPNDAVRMALSLRNTDLDIQSLIQAVSASEGVAKGHLVLLLAEKGASSARDILQSNLTANDDHIRSLTALALIILGIETEDTLEESLMAHIPSGQFTMGENKPRRKTRVDGFLIDRFPLTNAQYMRFVAAGGYQQRTYWSTDGWTWKEQAKLSEPPYLGSDVFNILSAPVVGISWYEAEAYATWSGKRMLTESEWERAARGDRDRREYPWGNAYHQDNCNVAGIIDQPTPVGSYPSGVSPHGCYDMAGNVWEWTSSVYEGGKNSRVLRGGSWGNPEDHARCAHRYWNSQYSRYSNVGVRFAKSV